MNWFNNLSPSEKRTIQRGAIVVACALALLCVVKVLKLFGQERANYREMLAEARQLRADAVLDADDAAVVKKLMTDFQCDPATLSTNSTVAGASAALQKAASSGGVAPGAIQESPGDSEKTLATIQFECSGQIPAVMALLHRVPLLGYPLVIHSLQLTSDPQQPGRIKLNMTINVLNFESWKEGKAPNA